MKTLVAYTTKHGATEKVARRIAEHFDAATLHDLRAGAAPDLTPYECVIVGSPLYAGNARKEATEFVTQNAAVLKDKRLGLFFSGLETDKQDEFFTSNYPADVLEHAVTAPHIGGVFDPKKVNFAERLIMKAAAGKSGFSDSIDDGRITQFVDELKGA